jgi:hypothetical protein
VLFILYENEGDLIFCCLRLFLQWLGRERFLAFHPQIDAPPHRTFHRRTVTPSPETPHIPNAPHCHASQKIVTSD